MIPFDARQFYVSFLINQYIFLSHLFHGLLKALVNPCDMQKIDCGTYSRYAFHIADTIDFLSSPLKCSSQFFVIIFRTL